MGELLGPEFFHRPVLDVARALLGAEVCCDAAGAPAVCVRLTEVEAYDGAGDPGSHAYRGVTPRNAVMFGPPGRVYVYRSYGLHWCMNVVCGPPGRAAAALLRAGEVVDGVETARQRRPAAGERALARGPACLAAALGVSGEWNGMDATTAESAVQLRAGSWVPDERVRSGPRVGVSAAAERPWRFWVDGDPCVSSYRAAAPRRRTTARHSGLRVERSA